MKDMKKLTILMVAVVAIGVFSLPSVLSLGTGQHKFLNGASVQCGKCHANSGDGVFNELMSSTQNGYNASNGGLITNDPSQVQVAGGTIHNSTYFWTAGKYDCSKCHTIATGGRDKPVGGHTGVKINVVCKDCHAQEYAKAIGTNLASGVDAHKGFVENGTSTNGTYACMGCHTMVRVAGSPSYIYSAGKVVDGLSIGGKYSGTADYSQTSNPMTAAERALASPPQ
ncbi:MAG: cytochrome c3 family protein [Candidatus Methanoperedens sp.]|nr:cytochrome c3 family protein [Candidatus Methanoperedens sp.]